MHHDESVTKDLLEGINDEEGNGVGESSIPTLHDIASSSKEGLDVKHTIAYKVLCCSLLLNIVLGGSGGNTALSTYISTTLQCDCADRKKELIRTLRSRGAQEQLIMLLSGPAGCGKSTLLKLAQKFCHRFCIGIPFSEVTFYFTSTTGSFAALFGGTTVHSTAHLNKKCITDDLRREWEDVRLLIIGENSFSKVSEMEKLDKNLKGLMGRTELPFGGISIVFSGDFRRLQLAFGHEEILYSTSPGATMWEISIDCVIFLENITGSRTILLMARFWAG